MDAKTLTEIASSTVIVGGGMLLAADRMLAWWQRRRRGQARPQRWLIRAQEQDSEGALSAPRTFRVEVEEES